jgi:tetratricopeptide (TPR) repeat protein
LGVRFRRSIQVAPGLKLNLTKTGVGATVGGRYARYSVHSSGRHTRGASLPGTGLYYQSTSGRGPGSQESPHGSPRAASPRIVAPVTDPATVLPSPGPWSSPAENAYHAGAVAYIRGDAASALSSFTQVTAWDPSSTSAHLFAAMAADTLQQTALVGQHLEAIVSSPHMMPDALQAKYLPSNLVTIQMKIQATEWLRAEVPVGPLGAALGLAVHYQQTGRLEWAIGLLQQIRDSMPEDPLVRLCLCNLLLADRDNEGVVELSGDIANDSDVEAETLHVRGKALHALGRATAALDVYGEALSRIAGHSPELLTAIRFDRAVALEQAGQRARARADFERVYAADPHFPGVRDRLATLADVASPTTSSSDPSRPRAQIMAAGIQIEAVCWQGLRNPDGSWSDALELLDPSTAKRIPAGLLPQQLILAGIRMVPVTAVSGLTTQGPESGVGAMVRLIPEPTNPVDRRAIAIRASSGQLCGYVPTHLLGEFWAMNPAPRQGLIVSDEYTDPPRARTRLWVLAAPSIAYRTMPS